MAATPTPTSVSLPSPATSTTTTTVQTLPVGVPLRLLITGATGNTGLELVKQSLKMGHHVTVCMIISFLRKRQPFFNLLIHSQQ
jgi:tellurite resistance protein TehA-like permease